MQANFQAAINYIHNAGGSVLFGHFDDDHEPIGPTLRKQLVEARLIREELNTVYPLVPHEKDKLTEAQISAHHFKNVETYCGVARLGIQSAMDSASYLTNPQLREDALITLQGTLEDIVAMYQPPTKRWQVETDTNGNWENEWFDDGKPETFATEAEALAGLEEFLREIEDSVAKGYMDEPYNPEDFRVREVPDA